jgi:hypothetical protein
MSDESCQRDLHLYQVFTCVLIKTKYAVVSVDFSQSEKGHGISDPALNLVFKVQTNHHKRSGIAFGDWLVVLSSCTGRHVQLQVCSYM